MTTESKIYYSKGYLQELTGQADKSELAFCISGFKLAACQCIFAPLKAAGSKA